MKFLKYIAGSALAMSQLLHGQEPSKKVVSTSTDLYIMPGSDFLRLNGLTATRANLNIGIGHTFESLKNDKIGDEVTFSYTYENAGSHGFWHTDHGAHTESLGLMKNYPIYKNVTGYGWSQVGISSFTGGQKVQNRVYSGQSIGASYHFSPHHSMWFQETYNKVNTMPWYTSTNVGYVVSW